MATEAMAGIATAVLTELPKSKNGLANGGKGKNNGKPCLPMMLSS